MVGLEGFGLLMGHMVGDYIVQTDWMAANKTNPHPGPRPPSNADIPCEGGEMMYVEAYLEHAPAWAAYNAARPRWRVGHFACTAHCLCYTLAVWAFSHSWMPWWGLLACFLAHWAIDRFSLAKKWMCHVAGQRVFAEKMAPWSIIVVDNTWHLLTLAAIWEAARWV